MGIKDHAHGVWRAAWAAGYQAAQDNITQGEVTNDHHRNATQCAGDFEVWYSQIEDAQMDDRRQRRILGTGG